MQFYEDWYVCNIIILECILCIHISIYCLQVIIFIYIELGFPWYSACSGLLYCLCFFFLCIFVICILLYFLFLLYFVYFILQVVLPLLLMSFTFGMVEEQMGNEFFDKIFHFVSVNLPPTQAEKLHAITQCQGSTDIFTLTCMICIVWCITYNS